MAIIPTLRCRSLRTSLAFYTGVLDFTIAGGTDDGSGAWADPAFVVLARGRDQLALSSHAGDGAFGVAVVVTTDDVDADVGRFRARGLAPAASVVARSPVHRAPVDQTWGTREFYVDDPDGHTLRFVQGWFGQAGSEPS
jgi:catechol 2,3-dioxygenase-like lactoylglutathione lyase family enzyme